MACLICGGGQSAPVGTAEGYEIVRCAACGFRYVEPTPSAEELSDYYQHYKASPNYAKKTARKTQRARRRLKRYIGRAPGRRFIDVGCNIGTAVKAAVDLGLDAYGIDIDEAAIATARTQVPEGHFHAGPIESLPDAWGQFDFVYSSEVIEHLPDPHAYFNALTARMGPGGLLYLTTPDAGHWRVPADFISWEHVKPPEHISYFTKDNIRRFLTDHGLKVIKFEFNLKPGMKVLARKPAI